MRRLGGQDAAFWYGETTTGHMHMATLMVLDPSGAPDFGFEQFKRLVMQRLNVAPQLRWRVVEMPLGLDRPVFIEDEPDPEFHIRHIAVPAPGGRKEVEDLVSHLMGYKIDRSRPLWEMWFIEGVEGDKVGLLAKCHHAIIDGVAGASMLQAMLDLEPEQGPTPDEKVDEIAAEPMPSQIQLLASGLVNTAIFTPLRAARLSRQMLRQVGTLTGWVRRPERPPLYFQSPKTRLNGDFSANRQLSGTTVDLNRVKAVKHALDVKVNDVVLALGATAIRNYLLELGELPAQALVAQVPVSLRVDDDRHGGGNKVSNMSVSLATDVDDPVDRLLAIYASSSGAKEMRRALSAHAIIGITEATPPVLIGLAARAYTLSGLQRRASPAGCVISNVPGPSFPFYVCGAKVVSFLPIGPPTLGIGLNMTCFSYLDQLHVGFITIPEMVPDVYKIADAIEPALAELEEGVRRRG